MTVLVTGATGFIGSQLCRRLVSDGQSVRGLHRSTSDRTILDGFEIEWIEGDLLDYRSLVQAVSQCETVVHCGGLVARWQDSSRMARSHTAGTQNILRASKLAGVRRTVHVSSVAALGVPRRPDGQSLIDESQVWNFDPHRWPYGYAKFQTELAVLEAVAGGLDAVIVNPSVVLGAGDVHRADDSIVELIARRKAPPILPPGGLNWVHIDDVIDGILAACAAGVTGERYILGAHNVATAAFVRELHDILGVRRPLLPIPAVAYRVAAHLGVLIDRLGILPIPASQLTLVGRHFYYDMSKAERQLRFRASRSLSEAVLETRAWYRERNRPARGSVGP